MRAIRCDRFPAQIIRPTQGKVVWMIDQAAASSLSTADRQVASQ